MALDDLLALRDKRHETFDVLSRQKEEIIHKLHQIKGQVELLNELIEKEEHNGSGTEARESATTTETAS